MFIAEVCLSGAHEYSSFIGRTYSNMWLTVSVPACSIDCVHQFGKYHLVEQCHCTGQSVHRPWQLAPKVQTQDGVLSITNVVMISTMVRWVGHIARVGCQKCKKILKAGDQFGDLGKDGKIILAFQSLPVTWCTNSLTFNNCALCPHCIYVFCIYLRTNSDLCH